jgi:hypothetical protein
MKRTCRECLRVFDLFVEEDVEEWYYGHDCAVVIERLPVRRSGNPFVRRALAGALPAKDLTR